MIVKMKKVILLCLDSERRAAMESLRSLGVMHVELVKRVESEECSSLAKQISVAEKTVVILSSAKPLKGSQPSAEMDGETICGRASELFESSHGMQKRLESLLRDKERLEPWGDFSAKSLDELKSGGIHAKLCLGSPSDLKELPEGVCAKVVADQKGTLHCLLLSDADFNPSPMRPAQLPDASLTETDAAISECSMSMAKIDLELSSMAPQLPKVNALVADLEERLEFASNRDGMDCSGEIAYINGYIPASEEESLRKSALDSGWGLTIDNPTLDDCVPTLLKNPKWLDVSNPIFDFIGISPGYNEFDVSIFVLFFLTIFFGIIVGDAGYGLIFMIIAVLCKMKFSKMPSAKTPLNLLMLFSASTIVWGLLTGSFFAIPGDNLPSFMRGIPLLSTDANREKNIQYICFLLAALHLSGARLFKAIAGLKEGWRHLGNLGWALFIWGNFFTAVELVVFKGSFPSFGIWLYAAGGILILATVDWLDLGTSLNLPFAFIGSFVDVLSYIRLYAVGMAGAYLASSFNNMGVMVFDAIKPSGIIALAVAGLLAVAIIGHVLNIILALLGVMVHGIRLNTLEFSNQMELQWAGIKFKPFKKNNKADTTK